MLRGVATLVLALVFSVQGIGVVTAAAQEPVSKTLSVSIFIEDPDRFSGELGSAFVQIEEERSIFEQVQQALHNLIFPSDSISSAMLIGLTKVPDDAAFVALKYDFPEYFAGDTVVVKLKPAERTDGSRPIKNMYHNTRFDKIKTENLPRIYQEARYHALRRIEKLHGNWRDLHDYDIIAAYLFLAVVDQMIQRQTFFVPNSDELTKVASFMREVISRNPQKVERIKPGVEPFKAMLIRVNQHNAHKYKFLWKQYVMTKPRSCQVRYERLQRFKKDFFKKNSRSERKAISASNGLTAVEILSSYAQCAAQRILCQDPQVDSDDAIKEIDLLLSDLRRELPSTYESSLQMRLKLRTETLEALKDDIAQNIPRTCPKPSDWS
jgi:hypothetical protein